MTLTVPLSVRIVSARADRHITRDLDDLSFRTVIPGGFASATMSLSRPLSADAPELAYYARVYVYGPAGQVVWEGRLEDPGRAAGTSGEIWELAAIGPSGHARDRTLPLIYIDRRISEPVWQTSVFSAASAQISTVGEETPAIQLQVPQGTTPATNYRGDITYQPIRHAGLKLARISFFWDTGVTDAGWQIQILTRTGAGSPSGVAASASFNTAGSGLASVVGDPNFVNGNDVVNIRITRTGAATTVANDDTWAQVITPAVRCMLVDAAGADITTGYTAGTIGASQVVTDLLGRVLSAYDGPNATVTAGVHVVDQLAYPDGTTAAAVLEDLMLLEPTFFWAAWESGANGKYRFAWQEWPNEVRYDLAASEGLESPGSADGLFNAVRVRWTDAQGRIRTTRRTQTVTVLSDAGLVREGFIDLGDALASDTAADQAGDRWLAEHASPPNQGSITVASPVTDYRAGRTVAPWELPRLAPGSLVRVRGIRPRLDALNATARDGVTVFRCVGAEYTASSATCRLTLDAFPATISRAVADLLTKRPRRR